MIKPLLKLIFSFTILFLVFKNIDVNILLFHFHDVSYGTLFFSITFFYLHLLIQFYRWYLILFSLGENVKKFFIFRVISISFLFGQILPSGIGTDGTKLFLLKKNGFSLKNTILSIFIDRIIQLIVLISIIIVSYKFYVTEIKIVYPYFLLALILILFFLILSLTIFRDILRNFFIKSSLYSVLSSSKKNLIIFLSYKKNVLIISLLYLISHLLIVTPIYLLISDMGIDISFLLLFIYIPLVLLLSQIPISVGGWGLRELSMIGVLSFVGVPKEIAFATSIIFGFALLTSRLPGIFFLIIDKFK